MENIKQAWSEVPVDRNSVRQLIKDVRILAATDVNCSFRIGDITDGSTLVITTVPIAPWRIADKARVGTDVYLTITQQDIVPTADGPKKQQIITPYRLETATLKGPNLKIAEQVKDSEIASQEQSYDRVASQVEADTLQHILTALTKKNKIINKKTGETVRDAEKKEDNRKRMIRESERIFTVAQPELYVTPDSSICVELNNGQNVKLSKNPKESIQVQFTHIHDYIKGPLFTEYFHSSPGKPILYQRTTMGESDQNVTPLQIATDNQLKDLFTALHELTDERIEKEVMTRQAIRAEAEKILEQTGVWDGNNLHATISYPLYTLEIVRIERNKEIPPTIVTLLTQNELGKMKQFCLEAYSPMYIIPPINHGQPETKLATAQEQEWLRITLSNINKLAYAKSHYIDNI